MKIRKINFKIPRIFNNRYIWEIILAFFFLVLCIFFIKNEQLELLKIKDTLIHANIGYVLVGIVLTLLYIFLMGLMYLYSFRSIGKEINVFLGIELFLKRNLISVFLPAGGVSSLIFFTKKIEQQGINKTQIHFASYIYALCGILSVVVVAIPALIYLFLINDLHQNAVYGFLSLLLLVSVFLGGIYSIYQQGWLYRFITKRNSDLGLVLDELRQNTLSKQFFIYTLLTSVGIELLGVAHLYIAILALHLPVSLMAAIIGYIIMVILLVVSPFLRGIGAIEISVTYYLLQYGYDLTSAATITLLFRLFEFWLPLLAGIFSFLSLRDNILYRVLPTLIILFLGFTNIISAIIPAVPARIALVQDFLPKDVIYLSNYLVILSGLILIVLSVYLLQGVKSAWWLAVFLTSFSVLGHLIKALDYEEGTVAFIALVSLMITRKSYVVKVDAKFRQRGLRLVALSIAGVFVYGILGFYLLDTRHCGIDFNFKSSITNVVRMLFLLDTSVLEPHTVFARFFLNSIYLFGFASLLITVVVLIKPFIQKPIVSEDDRDKAILLIEKYAKSSFDYFKTYIDKIFFFSDKNDGFVAYRVARNYAIVLENPVCRDDESKKAIVKEFEVFCLQNGVKSFYYRIPECDLPLYKSLKKKSLLIGQEAILNLQTFTTDGGKMKSIRNALKKTESTGCVFKINHPPIKAGLMQKLEQVSDEWLEVMEREELGFTQGFFVPEILSSNIIMTVENAEEKVVAFLNIVPDYNGKEATYDLIRKSKDAPGGVLDFLMVNMFLYLKEQGFESVNLGLAPLAGIEKAENITQRTIKYAYDNLRRFSHFKGLYEYKDKFMPEWQNRYLIYENDYDLLQFPAVLKSVSKVVA